MCIHSKNSEYSLENTYWIKKSHKTWHFNGFGRMCAENLLPKKLKRKFFSKNAKITRMIFVPKMFLSISNCSGNRHVASLIVFENFVLMIVDYFIIIITWLVNNACWLFLHSTDKPTFNWWSIPSCCKDSWSVIINISETKTNTKNTPLIIIKRKETR